MALALEAAVPLAIPSAIATWMETVAGNALAARAAQVAEIESESSGRPADAPSTSAPPPADVTIPVFEAPPGQTTSVSVTTGPRARPASARRTVVGVAAGIAVAAGLGVWALARTGGREAPTVNATATDPASPPSAARVAESASVPLPVAVPAPGSASAPPSATSPPSAQTPATKTASPARPPPTPRRPGRRNGLFEE
jgi:hypothetical protein